VKQSLITRAARATLTLIAIAALFFGANHCVLAGFLPKVPAPSAEPSCPGHPAPEQGQEPGGCDANSCCKTLAAPVAFTKAAANYDALNFVADDFPSVSGFHLGEQRVAALEEVDTGPPRPVSFAESVLQRSLLAHAPPFAV
jgi:hypothetical protein